MLYISVLHKHITFSKSTFCNILMSFCVIICYKALTGHLSVLGFDPVNFPFSHETRQSQQWAVLSG